MTYRRLPGVSLAELIVSISVTALILGAIFGLMIQTSRMYAATSGHVEPQASMMLGIKRVEADLRQAMSISTNSRGTRLDIVMPLKANGYNVVTVTNAAQGLVGLQPGLTVTYLVGMYTSDSGGGSRVRRATLTDIEPWSDPHIKEGDPSRRTAYLFRTDSTQTAAADGTYAASQVTVVVAGITPTGFQPNADNPNQRTAVPVFAYGANAVDAPDLPDTRLAKLTFTIPVLDAGSGWNYQTLQTQLCLRNMATAGQGP